MAVPAHLSERSRLRTTNCWSKVVASAMVWACVSSGRSNAAVRGNHGSRSPFGTTPVHSWFRAGIDSRRTGGAKNGHGRVSAAVSPFFPSLASVKDVWRCVVRAHHKDVLEYFWYDSHFWGPIPSLTIRQIPQSFECPLTTTRSGPASLFPLMPATL